MFALVLRPTVQLRALALAAVLGGSLAGVGAASAQEGSAAAAEPGGALVYHQISDITAGTGSVGFPVLSGDGATAVLVDAPGTEDPATPNRIFTLDVDGGQPIEVDAYQTHCYCGSWVDLSGDGETIVSTE